MASVRFDLYVKADSSANGIGDCPFSLKALMYSQVKAPNWSQVFKVSVIDLQNKSAEFLKLNPSGTAPVLLDRETGKVVTDSGEITSYLNKVFPDIDTNHGYDGPAVEATSGIFPKLVALLKNSDPSLSQKLKEELTAELKALNTFLESRDPKGKYLLGNNLSELDCNVVPKLKILVVAGEHYRNYKIPSEFKALHEYINNAMDCSCFKSVCPKDSEFIHGWKRHGITPDPK